MSSIAPAKVTSSAAAATSMADIPATVARVRAYFASHATKSYDWRRRQLEAVLALLTDNEAALIDALHADLRKPKMEAAAGEVVNSAAEVREVLSQLKSWMKPESVHTPIALQPASSYIVREPYGVMLLIGPFNYPISIIIQPLVAAIAAGNTVVIKPSELTPAVSALLARLIPQYLDQQAFAVVEGAIPETTALLRERWDYIFFTGSQAVGRVVARAAAEQLTPVTLELGGQNPVIVDADANVELAARRTAWGTTFNAGQVCLKPNHVWVHESVKQRYIAALGENLHNFFGAQPQHSPDFARMASERHTQRLASIIDAHKADIVHGGRYDIADKYIEPTILDLKQQPTGRAMEEELFGPVMVVLGFTDLSSVLAHINAGSKPLALYLFTKSAATQKRVLNETSSGGVVINDNLLGTQAHNTLSRCYHARRCALWIEPLTMTVCTCCAFRMHHVNPNLPFGGVGGSGMGAYHTYHGYRQLSHAKAVLHKSEWFDAPQRYPPYTDGAWNLFRRLMEWRGVFGWFK